MIAGIQNEREMIRCISSNTSDSLAATRWITTAAAITEEELTNSNSSNDTNQVVTKRAVR